MHRRPISTMKAKDYDAWVKWLLAPTKPQCFGLLARRSGTSVTAVCAIGGGCLAVGQDPSPSSSFYADLPPGLYANISRMNDEQHLPFSEIADWMSRTSVRAHYVRSGR